MFLADIKDFEVHKLMPRANTTSELYNKLNILMIMMITIIMMMMMMNMMNTQAVNEVYKEFFIQDFPARAAIQVRLKISFHRSGNITAIDTLCMMSGLLGVSKRSQGFMEGVFLERPELQRGRRRNCTHKHLLGRSEKYRWPCIGD